MILPPATLGMLGGGQLGRFFVSAAHEMGYKVWVLDPDPHSPAGLIADRHLIAAYDDYVALKGENGPSLLVKVTAKVHGHQYRAVPANAQGSATTKAATLSVKKARPRFASSAPGQTCPGAPHCSVWGNSCPFSCDFGHILGSTSRDENYVLFRPQGRARDVPIPHIASRASEGAPALRKGMCGYG